MFEEAVHTGLVDFVCQTRTDEIDQFDFRIFEQTQQCFQKQ